jgi:tetratricopeptide (TPR) repeat protein
VKIPFRPLACALLVALPMVASAQTAVPDSGPKLATRGTNATAPAGPGAVTVKVFVKKDGTFDVAGVLRTTNPGDNAAALEIAKSSTYKPAVRGGQHTSEFYDYALSFGGDTAAIGTGPVALALTAIHDGKYDQARAALAPYLQAHPDDAQANSLLGVADGFSGDAAGAAAAFDKAGTIPDEYKSVALQAYAKDAGDQLDAKNFSAAIAAADRALAIDPQNLQSYYVRGIASANTHDDVSAIADLQKAAALATAAKANDTTLATVDYNLAIAQLDAGHFDDAATTAAAVSRYDAGRRTQLDRFAAAAYNNSAVSLANAGKIPDAVSRLESGAAAFPATGGTLTAEAAYIMATDKNPDWGKVRAEAVKALALDPSNARAAYVAGIASARLNDPKAALDYVNKAKAAPGYGSDAALAKQIDDALKALNPAGK